MLHKWLMWKDVKFLLRAFWWEKSSAHQRLLAALAVEKWLAATSPHPVKQSLLTHLERIERMDESLHVQLREEVQYRDVVIAVLRRNLTGTIFPGVIFSIFSVLVRPPGVSETERKSIRRTRGAFGWSDTNTFFLLSVNSCLGLCRVGRSDILTLWHHIFRLATVLIREARVHKLRSGCALLISFKKKKQGWLTSTGLCQKQL